MFKIVDDDNTNDDADNIERRRISPCKPDGSGELNILNQINSYLVTFQSRGPSYFKYFRSKLMKLY